MTEQIKMSKKIEVAKADMAKQIEVTKANMVKRIERAVGCVLHYNFMVIVYRFFRELRHKYSGLILYMTTRYTIIIRYPYIHTNVAPEIRTNGSDLKGRSSWCVHEY